MKIKIGVICGMEAEAAALGRWRSDSRVFVGISGARPDRAEELAQEAVAAGAHTLVSWGLAGGLANDVASGALIQPGAVIMPNGTRIEFTRGMMGDIAIAGSDVVLATRSDKSVLRGQTGAIAVDMESHRLAMVASDHGLDLKIIRAISDPFDRTLPALAATALGPDGRPRIGRVLLGLLSRPWDLPALLAAKKDSDRALATLRQAADAEIEALLQHVSLLTPRC